MVVVLDRVSRPVGAQTIQVGILKLIRGIPDILSTFKLLLGGGRLVVAGGFDFSDEVALASCEALMGF